MMQSEDNTDQAGTPTLRQPYVYVRIRPSFANPLTMRVERVDTTHILEMYEKGTRDGNKMQAYIAAQNTRGWKFVPTDTADWIDAHRLTLTPTEINDALNAIDDPSNLIALIAHVERMRNQTEPDSSPDQPEKDARAEDEE